MIQASNVCLSFGAQTVFDHLSFLINQSDRIGLVGRNGSGKTTLLKAIIDPSFLDKGSITIQKNKKIAYMPQEVVLQSSLSILEETFTTFKEALALQQELIILEKAVELSSDPEQLERYAFLQQEVGVLGIEELKAKTKKILMGLGFSVKQLEEPIDSLSVGWKMRIVLAKLLLQEADFYLFDEPTNHLDLIAKEWFLQFLKESSFGFMLICHERYFLDELCDKIFELELGKGTMYSGSYSQYEVKKEHDLQLLHAAYIQQQKDIARKQATIERFRASASKSRMAQSMEKSLEKVERIVIPPSPKSVHFNFPSTQQSGNIVINVQNVGYSFGDKKIFHHVSFEIKRGHKVALIAPNGVGKTTLFNIIAGILPLQQGAIMFGHNVSYATFAQDQNKELNLQRTILENLLQRCPKTNEQTIRTFLGSFLFSGEDVLKKVGVLSGGEKNRVGMISVLLQQANLLLLDEPTNHLDIPSKEILLKALKDFKGTLLFVSHDRDFINALATDIIELTPQGAFHYEGNYDDYIHHKKIVQKTSLPKEASAAKKQKPSLSSTSAEQNKKVKQVENNITTLEKKIKEINESFALLEYGTERFNKAVNNLQRLQQELAHAEKDWELLQK